MTFRLSPEMMEEIAVSALNKGRGLLLVKTEAQAEKVQAKLREAITKELDSNAYPPVRGRQPAVRPPAMNPTFVQITNGGWIFVWAADDMSPDDPVGEPEFVYWPSEGGAYEKVTYDLWKRARLAGNIYRPVTITTAPKKTRGGERPTAWDRLLDDEDD